MKTASILLTGALYVMCSCAGVKIYSDPNLKSSTGLKFYYAKPFLLVERNPAKDVTIKSTIIYLPDLANPSYAKTIRGLGSNDLKVAFESGAISSYGVTTDTKLPETITSLAGLVTGATGGIKSLAEAKQILSKVNGGEQAQSASVAELKEAKSILDNVKKDVDQVKRNLLGKDIVSENQKIYFASFDTAILAAANIVNTLKPDDASKAAREVEKALKLADDIKSKASTEAGNAYNGKLDQLKDELSKVKQLLSPEIPPASMFELYEIRFTGQDIHLKPVILNR